MTTVKLAAIGLGSNRNAHSQIKRAQSLCAGLPHTRIVACSRLYSSQPWGGAAAGQYINAVLSVETTLTPWHLLKQTQNIERSMGRIRGPRYGSRCIDIDLLWYQGAKLAMPWLTLPHQHLLQRRFALEPLAEVLPEICLQRGLRAQAALWRLLRKK